jgi:ACS family hexuronate transporter-like MFS transporter
LRFAAIEHQENPEYRARQSSPSQRRSWFLVALLFLIALVNYFDRQSLSVVAPRFQAALHLSDQGYGHVVSLFLLASAFSYAVSGFITDWLGTRFTMALFVGWWSTAEAATAIVRSAVQLAAARFCLGLGEPGLWVAAPKAVGEILPKKDHALAVGIYTLGSTVGAVIALPAIAFLVAHLPWQSVFLIDGCAGLLCVPVWLMAYPSQKMPSLRDASQLITPVAPPPKAAVTSLKEVLVHSRTWKFMIARGLTDPVWYFYLFWFPKYMLSARGLTLAQAARMGWLVYLGAGAGTLLGGALAGWFIRRGVEPSFAYRRTMLLCALLIPLSPLAGLVPSALLAVAIASVIAMAHMGWLVSLSSAVIDLYPPSQLGTAFGLIAAGSGFGGMVSTEVVGFVVMHHGYLPLFFMMMVLHPLALLLLWKTFSEKPAVAQTAV